MEITKDYTKDSKQTLEKGAKKRDRITSTTRHGKKKGEKNERKGGADTQKTGTDNSGEHAGTGKLYGGRTIYQMVIIKTNEKGRV